MRKLNHRFAFIRREPHARIVMNASSAVLTFVVVLAAIGCARTDWIESTLTTADVTGQWAGALGRVEESPIELQLKQSGARVTGTFAVGFIPGQSTLKSAGELEGNIKGDVFRFKQVGGEFTGELTIGVDEMTGWVGRHPSGRLKAALKRR